MAKKAAKKPPKPSGLTSGYKSIGFTGTAGEYFGIWIVTLILTIITVGMYWPWAKVRRRRFFASHTGLAGFDMGYHATGWQLFKGFILVVILLIAVSVASNYSPDLSLVIFGVSLLVYPWAINASLRFHARNTSWRNIRLDWKGRYWAMFALMYITYLANIISLFLLLPVTARFTLNYFATRYNFGTVPFSANLPLGKTYRAFFIIFGLATLPIVGLWFLLPDLMPVENPDDSEAAIEAFIVLFLPLGIAGYILYSIAFTIFSIMCRNYLVQTMALGKAVKFDSAVNPLRLIWIEISNTLAVIFTLGLMIPWATVRRYRYLCSVTGYKVIGDIDSFVGDETKKQSAFGEEFAAAEGLDFGL